MDQRAAFARAWGFVNFNPAAKWAALISGSAAAVLVVLAILTCGLFADLLLHRGMAPEADELTPAERDRFVQWWNSTLPSERTVLLGGLGLDESTARAAAVVNLASAAGPDQLRLAWRAHVGGVLADGIGPEAVALYREQVQGKRTSLGVLGPVVRSHDRALAGPLVGWLVRSNRWLWQFADPAQAHLSYLLRLELLTLVIGGFWVVAVRVRDGCAARAAGDAALRMRRAVYHHTFRLGAVAFRRQGAAEPISLFTRHIETIQTALENWLTTAVPALLQAGLLLLLAFLINFWLTLVVLLLGILASVQIGGQPGDHFGRMSRTLARAVNLAATQLALLQESLRLVRLVKCHGMEVFHQKRVERQLSEYHSARQLGSATESFIRSIRSTVVILAGLGLLLVSGLMVFEAQLGAVGIVHLLVVLGGLLLGVRRWLDHRRLVESGRVSAIALFKFLDLSADVSQGAGADPLPRLERGIEIDNVSFREPGSNRLLLQDITLAVAAGQRVALLGPDDQEKLALLLLIPRFLDPTSGEIRFDEHNLRWVSLDSLRRQIGLVLQSSLVFSDSVVNNITGGDEQVPMPRVIEVARQVHAHQFIQNLPRGYSTPIGEGGQPLNVGEQFRIALARAVLRDPAVLVIEEPAGYFIDEDTRGLIDDSYARLLPGRTVFFIPRREETLQSCDQILVLNKGRIEALGNHASLAQQSLLYQHLYYLEFNPFAPGGGR